MVLSGLGFFVACYGRPQQRGRLAYASEPFSSSNIFARSQQGWGGVCVVTYRQQLSAPRHARRLPRARALFAGVVVTLASSLPLTHGHVGV